MSLHFKEQEASLKFIKQEAEVLRKIEEDIKIFMSCNGDKNMNRVIKDGLHKLQSFLHKSKNKRFETKQSVINL